MKVIFYYKKDNSDEEGNIISSSSSGGGGSGGSLGKRISLGAEWSRVELRVNEKVLFDYDNESHHIFVDKINDSSVDISVYSERVAL